MGVLSHHCLGEVVVIDGLVYARGGDTCEFGYVCDSPVCPRLHCFQEMGQPVDRCVMDRLVRVLAPALIVAGSGGIGGYLPTEPGADGGGLPAVELRLVGVFVVDAT